jgi:hypothetical protein
MNSPGAVPAEEGEGCAVPAAGPARRRAVRAAGALLLLSGAALLVLLTGSRNGETSALRVSAAVSKQTGLIPTPIGVGHAYHPSAPSNVAAGAIAGMYCEHRARRRFEVHVEVFANRRVVLLPAGIGIAPPYRRARGLLTGRCAYPALTRDPTGVVQVLAASKVTLGELFSLWGQPLSRGRLADFSGRVSMFIDGRRIAREPRSIKLHPHQEIVLEIGGYIPPHSTYSFPEEPTG